MYGPSLPGGCRSGSEKGNSKEVLRKHVPLKIIFASSLGSGGGGEVGESGALQGTQTHREGEAQKPTLWGERVGITFTLSGSGSEHVTFPFANGSGTCCPLGGHRRGREGRGVGGEGARGGWRSAS